MAGRAVKSLLFSIAVAYVIVAILLFVFQRNLLYFPDGVRPTPAAFGVADMRPVELHTADGIALLAWWKPPASPNSPVMVFFHGNAGHIGYRGHKVRPYLDRGWGVLLVAWRGYSGNGGAPSETGLYEDGRAALRYLAGEGISPSRLVLYGESLGSGVAVQMATEGPAAAVVLEAPFSSIAEVAQARFPVFPARLLLRDRFDSIGKIARIRAPLLVVHGKRDEVIPLRFGRRLFEAAVEPKAARFLDRAGHNDLYQHGGQNFVVQFVEKILKTASKAQ